MRKLQIPLLICTYEKKILNFEKLQFLCLFAIQEYFHLLLQPKKEICFFFRRQTSFDHQ